MGNLLEDGILYVKKISSNGQNENFQKPKNVLTISRTGQGVVCKQTESGMGEFDDNNDLGCHLL